MGLTLDQRRLLFRYDRELPLDAETSALRRDGDLQVERFGFAGTHGQRVPAVLYRRAEAEAPLPVIIIGHGAGQSKDDPIMKGLFAHWADAGFGCVSIDTPFHGERGEREFGPTSLLLRPFSGLDFVVQTVVDLMRTVDWIETRPDLNAARIAYVGFSLGTILGVQFVALDTRVRAAVFALGGGGVVHFLALRAPPELRSDCEQVADAVDPMHYAPLIAPRPVLMVNGLHDEVIPALAGHVLYNSLKEPRRIIWFDGGHGNIPREHIRDMRVFIEGALSESTPAVNPHTAQATAE